MALTKSILLVMLLSMILAGNCLAQPGNIKTNADVKALIERHFNALNAHDLKGVMETYAASPDAVLMGTGPGEVYLGDEAIGGAYAQFFTRFDPNTLSFSYDWILTASRGNFAWFAVTTTITGTVKNEKRERVLNMSGTLEKVKGKWRVVSVHFSRLGAEQQQGADQPK
jgi:uncharacterized protein (TIGR02246 family)